MKPALTLYLAAPRGFCAGVDRAIKIVEMARDLIRLHGLEPDRDIAIEFIGLRPGEKLFNSIHLEGMVFV